ncbi:MAG: HYR domain-containing protein, partial [Planctomycetota bacterium]
MSYGVSFADIDGDGDLDAFVANIGTQPNRVYLNDGSGSFVDSGQTLGSSYSLSAAFADLDGDGDEDVFVANYTQPNRVWLNDGFGTFTDSGQTLGSSYSYDVQLADLDGDGDIDAWVSNTQMQPNKVWLNDGAGTFSDSGQALGASNSLRAQLGDLDGDGDPDAFVANSGAQGNMVFLNDGLGVFTDSGQSLGTNDSFGVDLGDLDGDGDLDAFVANSNAGANRVWLNDGAGTFSDSGQALGTNYSEEIVLSDMDFDGDLDAFVVNSLVEGNQVWLNDGTGTFTDTGQSLGASTSRAVALADLDGDGDEDAFVCNSGQANRVYTNVSVKLPSDHQIGDFFPVGDTVVTYLSLDGSGNFSFASFTITVQDLEVPVISDMPANITLNNEAGLCGAVATWTAPTAADNCAVASLVPDSASGDFFPVGTTTVTYTATDDSGNTATATFTVTVSDIENPTITNVPADLTVSSSTRSCSGPATWTVPTANDNCPVTLTSDADPGDSFPVGTTTVTYTATDSSGNTATASFTVTVIDDVDPVLSGVPIMLFFFAETGLCSATVMWADPTASDNCAVDTIVGSHSSGDSFPVGATTVSYTATDIYGNSTTSTFSIMVEDAEAPVITSSPTDITQTNDAGICGASVSWTAPTATDNCSVTITSDHASGDVFPVGPPTVNITAPDPAGLTDTASFTVTVTDDEGPAFVGFPSDIVQSADAGACTAVVTWTAPTSADNCGTVTSLSGSHAPGDTFPLGTTTVTYTTTDDNANTTTASFTITVEDDELPVLTGALADQSGDTDAGLCTTSFTWTAPTASDNCPGVVLTSTHNPGDSFTAGVTTVTYTATDAAGNAATSSFTITVTDPESPTLTGVPLGLSFVNETGLCSAVAVWDEPTAADNCGIDTLITTHASGSVFPVGVTTVTYTATDLSGNITTANFDITIVDTEDPTISGVPADITQSADAGLCTTAVTWTEPT